MVNREFPRLAGMHEAAEILGVSDARVWQLHHNDPKFPEPVARLRGGFVWLADELAFYDLTRNKKGGRRKKVVES
jgi:predicted DNA-binding transcriptional regulator AlpA